MRHVCLPAFAMWTAVTAGFVMMAALPPRPVAAGAGDPALQVGDSALDNQDRGDPPGSESPDVVETSDTERQTAGDSTGSEGRGAPSPAQIHFSFKGASFQQVIDFFSRATGLPVIWEADAPEGTLDYVSPKSYDMREALRVLNIILQSKGVMLRVSNDMLYLQKLDQMQKESVPTFIGQLPETVTDEQITTVVRPLKIAMAKPLAEKLATMVAAYGSVTAMEQQNALVITETAGNVRRILGILDQLDIEDPEGVVEVFRVRHGKAKDILPSLNALMGQKVEKYVINQKGEQVKIEEQQMAGLSISADDRTNAIIAKGVQNKIDKLRETIKLLDVPAAEQSRTMTTMALSQITPSQAAAKLEQLYAKLDEKARPTVVPLDEVSKIMIIGDDQAVSEGTLMLSELENGPIGLANAEPQVSVIALDRADPKAVVAAITSLLSKRQQSATKLLSGPDGRSIIIAGMPADVNAVKGLIPILDLQSAPDRQVRLLRLAPPEGVDAADLVFKARGLFDQQVSAGATASGGGSDPQMELSVEFDPITRVVTMVGTAKAIDMFTGTLRQLESNVVVERESKRIDLANVLPSEIIAPLMSLANQLLQPTDGSKFVPPTFSAIDQLNMLVVTATPQQLVVLESLIANLDSPESASTQTPPLRLFQLRIADAANIANVINSQYNRRPPAERKARPVNIAADPATNALLVSAHAEVLPEIQAIIDELNKTERTDMEGREIRIFPLKVARAEELAKTIDEMFPQPPPPVDIRGRPQPHLQKPREVVVRADPQTNSLIVDAPVQRMAGFEELVAQLDRQQIVEETQVRTYQVVHADLNALANTLRQLAATGSLSQAAVDRRVPVTINTEPISQSIIVSGPAEIFPRVDQVLSELDVKRAGPATTLRFFKLQHAKAENVADMLRSVLTTRIRQDVPEAGSNVQALLEITADRKSNTLIVSAPEAVMPVAEEMIRQLDDGHTSIGDPIVRVRPLKFADAATVSATLNAALLSVISKATGEPISAKLVPSPDAGAILMVGLEADLNEIDQLIEPLDAAAASGGDQTQVRMVMLKHARAEHIAPLVQQLLAGEDIPLWLRYDALARNRQLPETGPQVKVAAEPRLNAVIVAAEPAVIAIAEQMIAQLDVDAGAIADSGGAAAISQRSVRVLTIANADASQLATNLDAIFSEPGQSDIKPTIRVDGASNSLIVRATDEQFAMIEQVVSTIDKASIAATRQMRLIPVDPARGKAEDIARALEQLIHPGAATDGDGPRVKVMTLEELLNRKNDEKDVQSDAQSSIRGINDSRLTIDDLEPMARGSSAHDSRGQNVGAAECLIVNRQSSIVNLHTLLLAIAIGAVQDDTSADSADADITIAVDPATNSLIILGSSRAIERVSALAQQIQQQLPRSPATIRYIALPNTVDVPGLAQIITQVLDRMPAAGPHAPPGQPAIRQRVGLIPDPTGNALIVAANDADFEIVADLIAALSKPASKDLPIRTIMLKRAQAGPVANAIQQFFDDRAKVAAATTGRRERGRRVSVMGIDSSNTLLVAANDDDFEQIQYIAEQFDTGEAAAGLTFRVFQLQHARATEIERTVQMLVDDLIWNQGDQFIFWSPWMPQQNRQQKKDTIAVRADARLNSLIVTGRGDKFDVVEQMIEVLDAPPREGAQRVVRLYRLQHAPINMVADVIREAFNQGRQRRPWELPDPTEIRVRTDQVRNVLIISATNTEHEEIQQLIASLDSQMETGEQITRVLRVQFARATELAQTFTRFMADRARVTNAPQPAATIVASESANTLIVSAEPQQLAAIEELLGQLDQSSAAGDRSIEIIPLKQGDPEDIARIVREQFAPGSDDRGRGRGRNSSDGPLGVLVTADQRTRSVIVNAARNEIEHARNLIERLDELAPDANQAIIIIDLQNVSPEAAKAVIQQIGMDRPQPRDARSQIVTEPIKVSTIAGRNALIVVASPADRDTVVGLLKAIDAEPAADLAQLHTRVFHLKHAQAAAVSQLFTQIFQPGNQQADTPLARAVREQVRRLAVDDAAAAAVDLTKPIRIVPSSALNALVISTTQANLAAIEQLVAMFDQLPITDAVTVQLYPLQNIAAEQFARILRDLFTQGKQLGRTLVTNVPGVPEGAVGKALMGQIAVSTDDRTNTVVVAGTEDAVALVEVLAKRIDAGIIAGWVEPKIIPLRYADATELADTLQAIVVEGSRNLPQSTPLQRQVGRLRMARMNHANGEPEKVLEADVFVPMTRLVIRPEPQMNALILVGTPDNLEVVGELVAMLDIESASPSNAVRIYPIQNASAARLAQTIRQLFDQQVQSKAIRPEDRVIVQADERTNALVVATSPRSFAVLENLLATLDNEIAPELREIRTIEVRNASAARLATIIQQMMDARLERMRRMQPETADLERATIIADPRTNSLIVAAGNDAFEVVRRLAADLDQTTLGEAALVHVIPLEKGNIQRIAEAVNQIMERRYADMPADVRRSQRPLVLTDSRTNSLLVAAGPDDVASIEDLVSKLASAPENPAVGVHVVPLAAGARAEQLAPRLQRLMAQRAQSLGAAGTPSDRVSIEPELASNSLIVAANDENLQVIRNLIEALTQSDAENMGVTGREVEIVMLSSRNRAGDMVDLLGQLYVNEANRTRGQNTVRVTADERLNAVLINAPSSDVRALKDLIAQLDQAKPAAVVEIKYIPLQSANALETVSLIENVLSGRGIGPAARRGSRQATVLKYLRQIADADVKRQAGQDVQGDVSAIPEFDADVPVEMEVSAAIRESITLTPDLRTNTIIVSAPRESIKMIEQMIRDLDASTTGAKNIRIFKLVNADAEAMAEILTTLFNLRQGNSMYVLKPREDGFNVPQLGASSLSSAVAPIDAVGLQSPGAAGGVPTAGLGTPIAGFGGTELTAVPDERQQLSITVDSRTNSLIVSGTPTYLDLVASVVEELDKLEANEREVFVYQLRNAVAEDVARVIGQFVEEEQRKLVSTLSSDQIGSAARLLEREITIAGDRQSNTVLVSASPRYMERVKEMIRQLDVDPPQVLIQVMLAEVTLDSRDEWGVDLFATADIDGTEVSGAFGLATAFVPGLGVPNLAIASSDFELLIRAMKAQGRLQVLSNPSIMTANNAPARIQVGETIRLPAITTISDTGQVASALEKEDLGVILKVTPSINPDGFVRMTINPEISNLSARTTQISEAFQSPIITRRTADTTVTVHDGQTIVIGGLISDRFERRDRSVPFFSELPVIGPLFRSELEETAKTELLIVLTPHVIESPTNFARVDYITDREIDRLSVPPSVKESIRRSLIDGTGGLFDAEGNPIDVKLDQ